MAKIKEIKHVDNNGKEWHPRQFLYWCIGCGHVHAFALAAETLTHRGHTFNMDLNCPTVSPSLLEDHIPGKICHSYITNGRIKYLGDSFHHLAGREIELPDIDKMTQDGNNHLAL